MKKCSVCGQEKELTEFYVGKGGVGGRTAHCKKCHGAKYYKKSNEARHNEEYLAKRRVWAGSRRHLPNVKAREQRHSTAYRTRYPEKTKAKEIASRAIKSGLLVPQACEDCGRSDLRGKDGRRLIQAHHHDYSKPLDVKWLCVMCHSKEHRRSLKTPPVEG